MSKLSSLRTTWLPQLKLTWILALVLLLPAAAQADELAVWNFNNSDFGISHGSGTLTTNFNLANVLFTFAGTTANARFGDVAGQSVTLQGGSSVANNGRNITFSVSTVGYGNIMISFAGSATSTGFNSNQLQYSSDGGVTFTTFGSVFGPGTSFGVLTFDLTTITALENNPDVVFRIIFDGATSSTGNNRLDNLVVEGFALTTTVPEPATIALLGSGLLSVAGTVRRRRNLALKANKTREVKN